MLAPLWSHVAVPYDITCFIPNPRCKDHCKDQTEVFFAGLKYPKDARSDFEDQMTVQQRHFFSRNLAEVIPKIIIFNDPKKYVFLG